MFGKSTGADRSELTLRVSMLSMLKGDLSRLPVFYEGVYSGKGQLHDARAANHEGSISALILRQ